MKFKGETVECESCGIEFNVDDDCRYPDTDEAVCPVCASKQYNNWLKEPCKLCGKPMKDEPSDAFWNIDEEYGHKSCVEKLSDAEVEKQEWCNET